MRVALAGKVSLSNLGGTSRPRRSSWGENLRYTSIFPNVSQIFKKSDFLKNLPKSRPKNGSDAEISINLARCRGPYLGWPRSLLGPYLARANSRAQCRGPYNFGGFSDGRSVLTFERSPRNSTNTAQPRAPRSKHHAQVCGALSARLKALRTLACFE